MRRWSFAHALEACRYVHALNGRHYVLHCPEPLAPMGWRWRDTHLN